MRAREFNGFTLATIHNEHFFVKLLDDIRASIDGGYFDEFRDETLARFYANGSRDDALPDVPPKRTLGHTSTFQGTDEQTRRRLFHVFRACHAYI